MIPLTLGAAATIMGGTLIDGADPTTAITGSVEFDSRKVQPGGLYLALPGARVDGHDFATAAVTEAGAVAAIVARPVGVPGILIEPAATGTDSNSDVFAHDKTGVTPALIEAVSQLARFVVTKQQAAGQLTVVGVTGSAGKTSTKDFLNTVLGAVGPTVAPPGSFNNELGLPYTALRIDQHTRFLVAEMSARGLGHVAHLCQVTPPTVGVELNVGSAHVGEFGSHEAIAQAKGELVESLPATGLAVLNADDAAVRSMAPRTDARVVYYSAHPQEAERAGIHPRVWASDVVLDARGCARFVLHHQELSAKVSLQVAGEHQVSNAVAAATVALELGADLEVVARVLSDHTAASPHRMDVRHAAGGVTIIDDAYNANPESMHAGLQAAAAIAAEKRAACGITGKEASANDTPVRPTFWAVLGDMGELGDEALDAHRAVGEFTSSFGVDRLLVVGESPNIQAMQQAAGLSGVQTHRVSNAEDAAKYLTPIISGSDVVFVKASNAAGLWHVADFLEENLAERYES